MNDCMICQGNDEVRNIEIYIIGSEGLDICLPCMMGILTHIRELRRVANLSRVQTFKNHKLKTTNQ